jgi:hypothetical protein
MQTNDTLPWKATWTLGSGLLCDGRLVTPPFNSDAELVAQNQRMTYTCQGELNSANEIVLDKKTLCKALDTTVSASAHMDAGFVKGEVSLEAQFLEEKCSDLTNVHFAIKRKVYFVPHVYLDGQEPRLHAQVRSFAERYVSVLKLLIGQECLFSQRPCSSTCCSCTCLRPWSFYKPKARALLRKSMVQAIYMLILMAVGIKQFCLQQ